MAHRRHAGVARRWLGLLLLAGSAIGQGPAKFSAFPEGDAAIDHLLLHFDPESGDDWLPVYRDLERSLPDGVRVTVAAHSDLEVEQMAAMLDARGITRPAVLVVGQALTPWARDRMLVVGGGQAFDLLTPMAAHRDGDCQGDIAAAGALADRQPCRCVPVAMTFEGGDIVCSGARAFLGAGTILANVGPATAADVTRSFQRLLGCEVVVLGKPITPHEHLDMYFTSLGPDTVALGDPVAGRELLERILRVAEPGLPDFDIWTIEAQNAVQSLYDEIHRALRQRGLRVLRVPILHGEQGGVLTWNNALVERRGRERRVYLPVYGVPVFDDAAMRA